MIIECPACFTHYDIKVDLPPEGRTVRCAKCENVWRAVPLTVTESPAIAAPKKTPRSRAITPPIFGAGMTPQAPAATLDANLSGHTSNEASNDVFISYKRRQGTKIFICYRRQDTKQIAGRIYDRLEKKFGRDAIFMGIDAIPPGADFHDFIENTLVKANAVLILIGGSWVNAADDSGARRLDDPNDFVRIEIEMALKRSVPIIPVLIDGTLMPRAEQLPESLHPLIRRNAVSLDVGRDFHNHMDRLIPQLERYLKEKSA
jgi:predicted Zn finger-like uncharacterized protein